MCAQQVERSFQDVKKTVAVNESKNTDFEVGKYKPLFPFICLSSAYFTAEGVTSTSVLDTSISLNPRRIWILFTNNF